MRRRGFLGVFVLGAGLLGAQTQGSVEVRTEDGVLSRVVARWTPAPGWEGRWWLKGDGAGSAWVQALGFQAGPLAVAPAAEGRKSWGPGTDLASGSWGLGYDGDGGGVWAVQTPERFEAGLQAALDAGPWSLAAGADRTWDLGLPGPLGPWVDRGRGGLRYRSDPVSAGLEATAVLPSAGLAGWAFRGRGRWGSGPWSLDAGGSATADPSRPGANPWAWEGGAGWGAYRLNWEARADGPWGHGEALWRRGGTEAAVTWGPEAGAGVKAGWEGTAGPAELRGTGAWALGPGGWDYAAGARAAVPWEAGRASLSWAASPGTSAPVQTVVASWDRSGFSFEARWRVEGFRLGWIGPGSSFRLTLAWGF